MLLKNKKKTTLKTIMRCVSIYFRPDSLTFSNFVFFPNSSLIYLNPHRHKIIKLEFQFNTVYNGKNVENNQVFSNKGLAK